jgi:four helix bundle protein
LDVAGARRVEDLIAWQLCEEVKDGVYEITARAEVARDFKFCHQIRGAIASASNNISEGFGRYRPREFGRFLDIAFASLLETKNCLNDGVKRGHVDKADFTRLIRLTVRASKATLRLRKYLRNCDPEGPETG